MFVRVARFEGGDLAAVEAEIGRMRAGLEGLRRGEAFANLPGELVKATSRIEMALDRGSGAVAVLVYCESEEQARAADRILGQMSPGVEGWGTRVSADLYEIALDETMAR
jgi:hypothetical protein